MKCDKVDVRGAPHKATRPETAAAGLLLSRPPENESNYIIKEVFI